MLGQDGSKALAGLDGDALAKLARRARAAPPFAHSHAFHLNLQLGAMAPADVPDWAATRLTRERQDAGAQCAYVRKLLDQSASAALSCLQRS